MSFLREADAEPIPGYRLIEPLGSGGFGEAWKCEAPGGLFKAIKFVFGNLNSLDIEGARAEQELHALQRIKEVRHPFVLSLDRIEVVEGELVIVMELADKSLHDIYVECQTAGMVGIPRDDLLRYMRDAAEALDHMNEKHNLQHLDIKPRNLFVVSDRVKVADFGLVKHLERQSASGLLGGVTPLYSSPETFSGKISGHSDQYSLAVVYQELLTGQRPFSGKNARQLAQQHMQEQPELRALPEFERPVLARALSKEPNKRFPNCMAFVRALYTVRAARPDAALGEPEAAGEAVPSMRPKTMVETLENIHLEHVPSDEDVNLGGPPPPLEEESVSEVSQLGMTVAQPATGALRPTFIIGVGSLGRRALLELRCRFVDRFGDLSRIPLLRFLYVDSDSEAVRSALRGAPEVAFQSSEVHHLPLRPIAHYRRKQLDQLSDWMPREKLYALPRSLKTQGSRALGRLAFSDNYLRFLTKLKREIQHAAHPDALYHSVNQTGLALRDNTPRVYVIASAGGGGSGMLLDMGFALRRILQQLRHANAPLTALVLCGAPEDPATPQAEQANVYATLTELNHFADLSIPFSAQYGADGPKMVEGGSPFDCAYLLTQTSRAPEARRDVLAHLCSYLFHELTTPLGLRLDHNRRVSNYAGLTPFRSLGTYSVWFPRGLLLRVAARAACKRLLEDWHAVGEHTSAAEVEATCARLLADPALRREAIPARIQDLAVVGADGTPTQALSSLLNSLEEQALDYPAQDDPGAWARQTMLRIREWLGAGLGTARDTGEWRKSRVSRALESAAQQAAAEWVDKLAKDVFGLTEHPGRRLAAAEAALTRLMAFCDEETANQTILDEQLSQRVGEAQTNLQNALEACVSGGGGFNLFGSRSRRSLRVFLDHLSAFARQCLEEDISAATRMFFGFLHGKLGDRLRDLTFCRQRLRSVQDALEIPLSSMDDMADTPLPNDMSPTPSSTLPSTESFWESIRESATTRVVLPEEDGDLEHAAMRFLRSLKPEHWVQLDQSLQENVLAHLGGLCQACLRSVDVVRTLLGPLMDQAAMSLGNHLPITDVAQVESDPAAQGASAKSPIQDYFDRSAPLVIGKDQESNSSFLLIPASDAGKIYGEQARQVIPNLHVLKVAGQADLMFCREQGYLSIEDMEHVFRACRAAYAETAVVVGASPHARFDVTDWVPLAP
jgi:eukaryotic-like serine/threonine-protein kinase